MKKLTVGILAHVDAGKTTLSEGLLYVSGAVRKLGRVDHGDAFLDTDALERERGITIFSKQAILTVGDAELTLLDTPGHVDFSAEAERTLSVLDYAILVISGTDGVQSHTRTLWKLLERYHVPTFLFVNKMDLAGADREGVLTQLQQKLSAGCIDFTSDHGEAVAMCDERALDAYLEGGTVSDPLTAELIAGRKVFPCWFGSALRLDGVEEFLSSAAALMLQRSYPQEFGARVFKISRDAQGARLTWLKVTGGALKVKSPLTYSVGEAKYEEKADQLRRYSGVRFQTVSEVSAGTVVAVTGPAHTYVGLGLGAEQEASAPFLEPVLTYRLSLPNGENPHSVLPKLRELEEEDPMLRVVWNGHSGEIYVQLMGKIQLEVLSARIAERFGLSVAFGKGSIVYRETIAAPVLGLGHFEPLRHYAEVQLLLEPLPRGSGVHFASNVPTDTLDLNWQRLIRTHIFEREHSGVLTGSSVTDISFTLVAGRAHLKHTEGGDFRQATYRAIRQGLMQAQTVLLEPYYDFRLEVPSECIGRAMTDLQNMGGTVETPETLDGETTLLTGFAPVAALQDYFSDVAAYTRGRGQLACTVHGYEPCRDQDAVAASIGYDAEHDTDNPSSSVFCDHGGSITIPWNEVAAHVHCDSGVQLGETEEKQEDTCSRRSVPSGSFEQDKELQGIFERTYGKVERKAFEPAPKPARTALDETKYNIALQHVDTEYLLVDGYNIIFAWDELKKIAAQDIDAARELLVSILSNYQGFRKCVVILVFDAYKVKGNPGSVRTVNGIKVVYTKEAETADTYIERATYELRKERRVRVATSDNMEQVIILGHGAMRVSAHSFHAEVEEAEGQISALIEQLNLKNPQRRTIRNIAKIKK